MANYKLTIDTKDIDRLAIGARIYDMLDAENRSNKLNRDTTGWYIREKDIQDMFNMVNIEWKDHISIRVEKS
jgi:hypothetical protein